MPTGKKMGGGTRPPVAPSVSEHQRSKTATSKTSKQQNQQPKAMAKQTILASTGPTPQEKRTLVKQLYQAQPQTKLAMLFLYDLVSAKLPVPYSIGYVVMMHTFMYGVLFAVESFQNLIVVAFGLLAIDAFFFYSKMYIPKSVGKMITSALKRARSSTTVTKMADVEAKDAASLAALERAELKLRLYFTFAGDNTEFAVMSHLTHLGFGLMCLGLSTVFNSPALYTWAALIMLWVVMAIPVLIEYKPHGATAVINIVDALVLPRKQPKPSAVVSTPKGEGDVLSFAQKLKTAEKKTNNLPNQSWSLLNNDDSVISQSEAPLSSTPMGVTRREKPNKKNHEKRPRGWSMLAQDENAISDEDARGWSLLETENTQELTHDGNPTTPSTSTWDMLNTNTTNDIEPRARGWSLLGPGVNLQHESESQSEIELRCALEGRLNASVATSTPVHSAHKQKPHRQNKPRPHHAQANQHSKRGRSTLQNSASVAEEDESFIVVPRS
eukprot:m.24223 g.24223  ORF g.24223 m.24223 type:complete len:497 (-) comp14506_c0_seq1:449-1939(-)